jgi:hypothetical protein
MSSTDIQTREKKKPFDVAKQTNYKLPQISLVIRKTNKMSINFVAQICQIIATEITIDNIPISSSSFAK